MTSRRKRHLFHFLFSFFFFFRIFSFYITIDYAPKNPIEKVRVEGLINGGVKLTCKYLTKWNPTGEHGKSQGHLRTYEIARFVAVFVIYFNR